MYLCVCDGTETAHWRTLALWPSIALAPDYLSEEMDGTLQTPAPRMEGPRASYSQCPCPHYKMEIKKISCRPLTKPP